MPRVFAAALPESVEASDTGIVREEMLRAMLPLVLLANEEILADRPRSGPFASNESEAIPCRRAAIWLRGCC